MAQSHTPCNRCVRFATTVASGHATLATKRTLLLTWAGLPPAGSHQLCLAHSLDHLVARASSVGGTSRPSALAVLRLITSSNFVGAWTGRSAGLLAFEDAIDIRGRAPVAVHGIGPIRHQTAGGHELAGRRKWPAACVERQRAINPGDERSAKGIGRSRCWPPIAVWRDRRRSSSHLPTAIVPSSIDGRVACGPRTSLSWNGAVLGLKTRAATADCGATCLSSSSHFPISSWSDEREPGDVAARPRQARDEAEADRIGHQCADDRDGRVASAARQRPPCRGRG